MAHPIDESTKNAARIEEPFSAHAWGEFVDGFPRI
jgi:hypothetical protein